MPSARKAGEASRQETRSLMIIFKTGPWRQPIPDIAQFGGQNRVSLERADAEDSTVALQVCLVC
jgi:hypothetical protein